MRVYQEIIIFAFVIEVMTEGRNHEPKFLLVGQKSAELFTVYLEIIRSVAHRHPVVEIMERIFLAGVIVITAPCELDELLIRDTIFGHPAIRA
jgi:hypothetical protein